MARTLVSLLALGLLSCSGSDEGTPSEPVCTDTYETFGAPFLGTWCTSCHSSALPEDLRYDAPVGVDFDSLARVRILSGRIAQRATGPEASMPPLGGPTDAERQRLADWIACGMPGEEPEAGASCEDPTERAGDVVIASAADAEALCASAVVIGGNLTITTSATLPCVCGVGGALTLSGEQVELPLLASVGADLTVAAPARQVELPELARAGAVSALGVGTLERLDLSELVTVDADLVAEDLPLLTALLTPRLETVGGSFRVVGDATLPAVDLSHLHNVGGDLVVSGDPEVGVLLGGGYDLVQVGGDLVLYDLDAWTGFYGFAYLERIGGDLRIDDNAVVQRINGFTYLQEVGGTVSFTRNLRLDGLDGFDHLATVGGDLVVAENPLLREEEGFAALKEIVGSLRIERNPRLTVLEGLALPTSLGGLTFDGNDGMGVLLGFENLVTVTGDVRILGMSDLVTIDTMAALARIDGSLVLQDLPGLHAASVAPQLGSTGGDLVLRDVGLAAAPSWPSLTGVGGDLVVDENAVLANLSGLGAVDAVDGDLVVTDNPVLPAAAANALRDGITTVGGTVTISGNAP